MTKKTTIIMHMLHMSFRRPALMLLWLSMVLSLSLAFAQPIYINIVVKDPSKVVQGKVEEKIGGSRLPGPLKRLATFGASALATKVAKPSLVAKKMCGKMPGKMTSKMKGNGLDVKVESIFREGPYFVLKLDVLKVIPDKLAQTAIREKMGCAESNIPTWVKRFESLAGESRQEKIRTEVIPAFVSSKMVNEMPKMMGKKLAAKGMVADINVVEEKQQDAFFDSKLREVRKSMEKDEEPKLTP